MRPPAFQFYADDFLAGTSDMTDAEVGLYIRLLCAQWSRGGIPNDIGEILRFSRGSTTLEAERVRRKFEVCEDGLLRNPRLEKVRQEQAEWRRKSSEGGKKSAEARAKAKGGSTVVPRVVEPPHQPNGQPNANTPVSSLRSPSPEAKENLSISTSTDPLEVEPPPGMPKSEKEARAVGEMIGVPPDFAATEWNRAAGRGWRDAKDVPIRNFRAHLKAKHADSQSRDREAVARINRPVTAEDYR